VANYYVSRDGKVSKDKDKKTKQTASYRVSVDGKVTKVKQTTKKKKKKEEDIAPVKKTTGGNKNSWFKSGGFSDGVDGVGDFFKDLGETTVGTIGDIGVGVGKGITRLGEGIVDLGTYGVAKVADVAGKDKWAEKTKKKAQKDWTSNAWKKAEKAVDKYSVLGNKSDNVTEGLGYVAGILATGGVAGYLGASGAVATGITTGVTGLSGMGSGMSEAYQNKATDKEAFTYGAITGTAEAATELLFGGLGKTVKALGISKGLSSADDMLAKKITSKFTNQIAKNFTEFGIKAGAEGTEEVLSGIAQAVGKKVTYMEEKELEEILKDENLLDQFIVGSITSGIAQSGYVPGMKQGSLREANKSNTDFITGLTQNEQKVVDKEYENRITEAEEGGKTLSKKEKNKIYDEVINDLEKGYISTDTIEGALGGETYKTYKNMTERENEVKKQIEELENKPFSQITVKEQEKLTELRKQLDTMEKSGLKNKVRNQLNSEVSELAMASKLSESYNEKTRRGEAFQADLTKYDAKQQDVIKKATESGILNNTNRTHEFVDMVAKISADKGVSFDFTNNQKLKDSGFAVEGKTVNGYVKDGNVAVNIDSNKSLNSVVGHEITHVLEGTELYTELQNAVKEYATTKGEYDTRFNELSELYKDVEGSNIESELTADLVGDYLFTDSDFINNLSTKKPNIFQKIYNEIKYLCKIATAGSKEARQLEKVKRAFDKAYKESANTNTEVNADNNVDVDADIKYSMDDANKGYSGYSMSKRAVQAYEQGEKPISKWRKADIIEAVNMYAEEEGIDLSDVDLTKMTTEELKDKFLSYSSWHHTSKHFNKTNFYSINNDAVKNITKEEVAEIIASRKEKKKAEPTEQDKARQEKKREKEINNKAREVASKLSLIFNSGITNLKTPKGLVSRFEKNSFDIDTEYKKAIEEIRKKDAQKVSQWRQLPSEHWRQEDVKQYDNDIEAYALHQYNYIGSQSISNRDVKSIVEEKYFNNTKYSLSDSDGKTLTKEQQEYFKDSKVRDENGNLKVMYHGSENAGFHEFSNRFSDDRSSFFFVDTNEGAKSYSGTDETYEAKTLNTAKDVNNFFEEINQDEYEVIEEDGEFVLYEDGDEIARSDSAKGIYDEFCDWTGLGYGSANYKVYLNLKNPLVVDAKNNNWDELDLSEFTGEDSEYYNNTREFSEYAKEKGYDGVIFKNIKDIGRYATGNEKPATVAVAFEPNQIKSVANENPTTDDDIRYSMSNKKQVTAPHGKYNVYGKDVALEKDILSTVQEKPNVVQYDIQNDIAPVQEVEEETTDDDFEKIVQSYIDNAPLFLDDDDVRAWAEWQARENPQGPVQTQEEELVIPESPLADRDIDTIGRQRKTNAYMYENPEVKPFFQDEALAMLLELQFSTPGERHALGPTQGLKDYDAAYEGGWGTKRDTSEDLAYLRDTFKYDKNDLLKGLNAIIEDDGAENNAISKRIEFVLDERLRKGYNDFMNNGKRKEPNQNYINLLNEKQITEYNDEARSKYMQPEVATVDTIAETTETVEDIAPTKEIATEPVTTLNKNVQPQTDEKQVTSKLENAETEIANLEQLKQDSYDSYTDKINKLQNEYNAKKNKDTKVANNLLRRIERLSRSRADVEADYSKRLEDANKRKDLIKRGHPTTRSELHRKIMDNMKAEFSKKGYELDKVLENAKNLITLATTDNTPQRVMDKALGYKEGNILSDLTVNKIAQNESKAIKWLDGYTNRKTGVLAQIVNDYKIKPGSKESAAAQMYAEGFYVDDKNNVIKYSDAELAKDFPDEKVRNRIKGLASDPRIRKIYDDTLDAINTSRLRNAYPEIPKRKDYFLHFRAMDDTFSKLGLPFNPNDIKAKDLPTDLNGVTADLEPGQPYFASAKRRMGKKTSHDLLGGLERYLSSAKNQIYHIDDIQNLRALRNYIADKYGQAHGLEDLTDMSEEEFQDRVKKVYNGHLSTFAKFLNEEANIIAGKTSLMDRGVEGLLGRRIFTFLDTVNKQVGSNMVGFNVSSAGTNLLPVVQTFAKTNKADFFKAFTQTVSNKISSIFGKSDGFAENNPTMIRRNGADTFYRTPYQKVADAGYVLMGAVDNISTELIVRTKYNEYVRKGMSHEEATNEADKWASRLMGDRSLGQQPQHFSSKFLSLFTKFQLEVRNQLDSQFYDTIQEAKLSNEEIQNNLLRNAKTSAKIASTFTQLAIAQHLFGTAFEKVVGYNPAFDVIEALIQVFGFDDEEDSEDTVLDNIEQGFLTLFEDLPYASLITNGGRIPMSTALPIEELVYGKDQYGEKSRIQTISEIAPLFLLPTGYGQIKKTYQGLSMFDDDLPISGSYTESGNLRFPIEDTTENKIKAGLFGQWANENARTYFDKELAPLKEKQIQEFIDVDMPINDYWDYREGLKEQKTLEDKFDYIDSLDLPTKKKNILINNIVDRKEDVNMENYSDFSGYEEFDFYSKYPEKHNFLMENNISYKDYSASDESRDAYNWAFNNPEKYTLSKAISKDVVAYRDITKGLYKIRADKDSNGKTIIGSAKAKKLDYINKLDIDYGEKLVLFKSEYNSDDTYNNEIIDYLNSREDITYEEQETILKQLGFTVTADGNIYWD
jgi:hypothetical protein